MTLPTNSDKVAAQFQYLKTLQAIYPKETISVKVLAPGVNEIDVHGRQVKLSDLQRVDRERLINWVPWNDIDAIVTKMCIPMFTRGTLLNEVFLDPDNPNWSEMKRDMDKVLSVLENDKIPTWERAFSGGKGIHISFLFNVSHFPEALAERMSSADIDVYKVIRWALFEEVFRRAGVDYKAACMDLKKVKFNVRAKGSQVRMIGTTRPDGMYKTQVDTIPDNKPTEPLPLRLPDDKPELWDIVGTDYEPVVLDALYKACEQADKAGDIVLNDEIFKDMSIAQFPCMQKLFADGVNGVGRYYAVKGIVLLTAKCGGERHQCEANAYRWLNEKTDLSQVDKDLRVNNAMSMIGTYPFSCRSLRDELGDDICNYAACPKRKKIAEIKEAAKQQEKADKAAEMTTRIKELVVPETGIEKAKVAKELLLEMSEFTKAERAAFAGDIKTLMGFTAPVMQGIINEVEKELAKKEIKTQDAFKESWKGATVPDGYTIEEGGLKTVSFEENKETGEPEEVKRVLCPTPCIITNTGNHIDTGEQWAEVTFSDIYNNDVQEWVQQKDTLTKAGIMDLTNKGLNIVEKSAPYLTQYFSKCYQANAGKYNRQIVTAKNGWKMDKEVFVFGENAYSSDRVQPVLMLQQRAKEGLHTAGTLDAWIEGVRAIMAYDMTRFKCYGAVAAMVLELVGLESCILDNSGESSTGKSATSRVSASMFGNPWKLEVNGNATQTGVEILAESYCDLPLFLDETGTQADERFLKNLIYMIANGQGRLRGNKDVTLREPSSWRTVAFTTGEQPITTMESFTGQQVRVINIKGGLPEGIGEQVKTAYSAIKTNHGHIAPLFIKKMFDNMDTMYNRFAQIRKEFANTESNTGDRMADHFAAFALAGELLESVFSDIGLETKDPKEITCTYFKACVSDKPIEAYSVRALRDVMDWIGANTKGFIINNFTASAPKLNGWIEKDYFDLIPGVLRTAIKDCKYSPDRVLPEWYEMGIIDTKDTKRYEKVTKKNAKNTRVIRIVRQCVENKLGIDTSEMTPDETTVRDIRENVEHFCSKWNKPINSQNYHTVVDEFIKWNPGVDIETARFVFEKVNNIC